MWNEIGFWGLMLSGLALAAGLALLALGVAIWSVLLERTGYIAGWLVVIGLSCGGTVGMFALLARRR